MLVCALLWYNLTKVHSLALPFKQTLATWCFSLIGKYGLTSVGMTVLRTVAYHRIGKTPFSQVVLCSYMESVLSVVSGMIMAAGLALILAVPAHIWPFRLSSWFLIVAVLPLLFPKFISGLMKRVFGFLGQPVPQIRLTFSQFVTFLLAYCMAWLIPGTSLFCLLRSISSVPPSRWLDACLAYTVGGILGMAAVFAPAGLGVREGGIIMFLSTWLEAASSIIASVMSRFVATVTEAAAILAGWWFDKSLQHFWGAPDAEPAGDRR
jgi:uncharacterized membrane protein YbhN (UPF0104 family)